MASIRFVAHYTVTDGGRQITSPPMVVTLDMPGVSIVDVAEIGVGPEQPSTDMAGATPDPPAPAEGTTPPQATGEQYGPPVELAPAKEAQSDEVRGHVSDRERGAMLSLKGGGHQ